MRKKKPSKECDKMKPRAGVHIGLAAALCGILPTMKGVYLIILITMIVILALSALILYLHNRVSWKFWQRLVHIADTIGINYMASSFGFVGAGISLMKSGWLALGIILLIIGFLLLGAGIGENLWEFQKQVSARVKGNN